MADINKEEIMSAIPAYGLVDPETGARCLSRNRRFNHLWFASKKEDYYDNTSKSNYVSGVTPQRPDEFPPTRMLFFRLDGAIQGL